MKLLLIALALQASGACDVPLVTSSNTTLMTAAQSCVVTSARRLTRSGERADLVADAALDQCRSRLGAVYDAFADCGGRDLARSVRAHLIERLRQEAVGEVVQIRATTH